MMIQEENLAQYVEYHAYQKFNKFKLKSIRIRLFLIETYPLTNTQYTTHTHLTWYCIRNTNLYIYSKYLMAGKWLNKL